MTLQKNRSNNLRDLHVLIEVTKALTSHLDLPSMLQAVMAKIEEVFDEADFGFIFLWDLSHGHFRVEGVFGEDFQDIGALRRMELHEDESITGFVFHAGKTKFYGSPSEIARGQANMSPINRELMLQALGEAETQSIVAAPLQANSQKYGVLFLGTLYGPAVFSETDLPFVQTLADLIALAIDRSKLEHVALDVQYAEEAEKLRAEALATLSHELRTPLAAIKGYSTALLLEEVDWSLEKQQDFLHLIEEECDNLQTMINDILDSSLIDVGQMVLAFQPTRLERLANEVAEEMQHRTQDHRLVVDFPTDYPLLEVDPLRIKQVMRNIIDNSIKYSPAGGLVVIRSSVRTHDVVISISDQGVGISPEDLIPLFDKYFRVKSPTGYHVPGTGLGLPVARAIVEAHGGRIWAESKVDEGTTLYFSLPRFGDPQESSTRSVI
jgi:K+-sensing histidine kinase KdpD